MGLRIKTNVDSLVAQRQLGENRSAMTDSLQKLSSGLRINKSSDDAAGLAVSETMRAKVKSMVQAKRNANDGISFLQVAEGGLSEANNMLVRMRELTTQAASDTIGSTERTFLNREFNQLGKEINRISTTTEFNGRKVLSPDGMPEGGIAIQIGATSHANNAEVSEDSEVIKLSFDQIQDLNTGLTDLQSMSIEGESGRELESGTDTVFRGIDDMITKVTDFRATIGALQSRVSSSITSLDVGMENMEAAQSRIRDVDYTSETARLTQSKILAAAGTAVLSQANSLPEAVLQLLR